MTGREQLMDTDQAIAAVSWWGKGLDIQSTDETSRRVRRVSGASRNLLAERME